jgi:hypothetical protein
MGEDERVPDRLAIPFQLFRNTGCRDLNPASRRVRWAEAKCFQLQGKLLASRGGWPN